MLEQKVKSKIILMIFTLGLMVGANKYFAMYLEESLWFLLLFDALCFAVMIVLLYGVRKDVGAKGDPLTRRGIFWVSMIFVVAVTLVMNQFTPKPMVWVFDVLAIILILYLFKGYQAEDREVQTLGTN